MKILVLGGTRFFGIHLVDKLIHDGHDVTVATRGITKNHFDNFVTRLIFDRNSRESIKHNLSSIHYDVVIDNICYSPNNTKNLLDFINTDRYIFTSSTAVYKTGINLVEEDYNPNTYKIQFGERPEFTYDEGKRLCEAVAFQHYKIPTTAVRFPIVLGTDDFTQRLFFYVDRIKRNIPINVINMNSQISFIDSKQAGEFLAFLANKKYTGAINACSDGTLTIHQIINAIENLTNEKAIISVQGEECAYNEYDNCTINSSNAKALLFKFKGIDDYFDDIITEYISRVK